MTNFRMSKTAFALILIGVGVVGILIVVLKVGWGGVKQPIEFSHKIHADNGMECADCHLYYKQHAASGRPALEICKTCHSELIGESAAEKSLREYIQKDQEIPWNRLFRIPPDVYFSHRRHVVLGEIKCATCHMDIGASAKPPARVRKMTMQRCLKCHEKSRVSNDCINCHR